MSKTLKQVKYNYYLFGFSFLLISIWLAYLGISALLFRPSHSYPIPFLETPITNTRFLPLPNIIGKVFNPSIITYKNNYLLSIRIQEKEDSKVGLLFLDQQFNPITSHIKLDLFDRQGSLIDSPEDARMVTNGTHHYLIFNTWPMKHHKHSNDRVMMLCNLFIDDNLNITTSPCLSLPQLQAWEKNWIPFFYQDELHFVYTMSPHTIWKLNQNTQCCENVSMTSILPNWDFGKMSGGTPALLINNHYASFFHSYVVKKKKRFYFCGYYLFSSTPPFEPIAIILNPLGGFSTFYTKENPKNIIFPTGLVFRDGVYTVSAGYNDDKIFLFDIEKDKLDSYLTKLA